jgi:hypothetical protein
MIANFTILAEALLKKGIVNPDFLEKVKAYK